MFQAEEATNNDSPDRTVWRAGQGLMVKTILAMMMKTVKDMLAKLMASSVWVGYYELIIKPAVCREGIMN